MSSYYAWKDAKTKEVKARSLEELPKGKPPEGSEEAIGPFEASSDEKALSTAHQHYYLGDPAVKPAKGLAEKAKSACTALLALMLLGGTGYGAYHYFGRGASAIFTKAQTEVEEWREHRRQERARERKRKAKKARKKARKKAKKRARKKARKRKRKAIKSFEKAFRRIRKAQSQHYAAFKERASLEELRQSVGLKLPDKIEVVYNEWLSESRKRLFLAHPGINRVCAGEIARVKNRTVWKITSEHRISYDEYRDCRLVSRSFVEKKFLSGRSNSPRSDSSSSDDAESGDPESGDGVAAEKTTPEKSAAS